MTKFRGVILFLLVSFACLAGRANALPLTVTGTTALTNLFSTPQQFTLIFTLPTAPLTGISESVFTIRGTLTDTGTDGVSMGLAPSAVAVGQALINGVGVIDLGPAVAVAGPWGPLTLSTLVDSANFGGVINTIGIKLDFVASAGDQFSFASSHTIQAAPNTVPAPPTLMLLGLALAGLGLSRRKPS